MIKQRSHASILAAALTSVLPWLGSLGTLGLASANARAAIVIHEIHYDPASKVDFEEFVELYNDGGAAVDLSGWFFSDGITFTFPEGARIESRGYAVVAEDPAALEARLGYVGAFGPYMGQLDGDGELLALRNARGEIVDQVDYGVAFPWPSAAAGDGSSMELIHPSLDNDLGSSWRSSGLLEGAPVERTYWFQREDTAWRFRKATSEASSPTDAWRRLHFVEDASWQTAQTSIGFADDDDNTILDDMLDQYTGIYLRKKFTVSAEGGLPNFVKLGLYVDDGCVVWINGVEVSRVGVGEGEILFDGAARSGREARWTEAFLAQPASFLVPGENIIAIHALNQRISSNDFSVDAELFVAGAEDFPRDFFAPPTPGAPNTVAAENAPPAIRQVEHAPLQPPSGTAFAVTARVTDLEGVARVELLYQIVAPGAFLPAFLPLAHADLLARPLVDAEPNPAFEDPANWTTIAMADAGGAVDFAAGDSVYTALIPGQPNRTMVRYRIRVVDRLGAEALVPYRDDGSLNFAAWVYDGLPPYTTTLRSVQPEGVGFAYSPEALSSVAVYTLLTRKADYDHCIAYSGQFQIPKGNENARDRFNWEGAFVYEGVVYDHVRYRLRQANDRYGGQGKRSMRIRFNKGNRLEARDNYGRKYPFPWRTLNTGKNFDNKAVGNFGLTESMNSILWNMVEAPAPFVHTFHFRLVHGAEEAPTDRNGQYFGDFQGMFLAFEDYDPRFLETHGLEDGNLYKLKDGVFTGNDLKRNQGRFAVTSDADFQNIRRNLRPDKSNEWLDLHVNYERWSRYHAVVEGIRHYDFVPADSHSKNRAWYFEPFEGSEFGRLWTLPHDSDASWGPNWNDGADYSKNAIFSGRGKEPYKMNYRNNMREFVDLVWTDELINTAIDDLAAFVTDLAKADRDRWRQAAAGAGSQDFGPMESKVADMKRFAFTGWSGASGPTVPAGGRRRHLEGLAGAQAESTFIPATPTITSSSPDGFPIDRVTFSVSEFSDPQPESVFGAVAVRIGEITPKDAPFDPRVPRIYEVPAIWQVEYLEPRSEFAIPRGVLEPGKTYRARARHRDDSGRWSHWSAPLEFVAGPPTSLSNQAVALRVTELFYHPPFDEALEFIEIQNTSGAPVDLGDVRFTDGIEFDFASGDIDTLEAGEYAVVVKNRAVFEKRWGKTGIRIAGEYRGNLANSGELIRLRYGKSETILDFVYDDSWYLLADGLGRSIVVTDPRLPADAWGVGASWRESFEDFGSPGREDLPPNGGRLLPGDVDGDSRLNITDPVVILGHLFLGASKPLPCGDGAAENAANRAVLDVNGDGNADLSDAVHLLAYLFLDGPPPARGVDCAVYEGCPAICP
jgi:hypothetical protein